MATGRTPYLEVPIDPEKPLRDCKDIGTVEDGDDRTIGDLAEKLTEILLNAARITGGSFEVLVGLQQSMRRKADELLATPETRELGEALQTLALRIQVGVGNPPSHRTRREREPRSPFNVELWDTLELTVRTLNAVENFLAKKFAVDKRALTVRNFFEAFSRDGHFDASEFKASHGVGETTFNEFIDGLKEASVITEALEWSSSFLQEHAL